MVEWLDDLCSKMHYFLKKSFNKEFYYDFSLASKAVENSIEMLRQGRAEHFLALDFFQEEVVGAVSIQNFDNDSSLLDLINSWGNSHPHNQAFLSNNVLGIGFSYNSERNILYSTIRLR